MTGNTALPQYPNLIGLKVQTVVRHTGPASYRTGGVKLAATLLELKRIDWVDVAAYTVSGNYVVIVLYPPEQNNGNTYVILQWFGLNGIEVTNGTNLSAEAIRLFALGQQ